MVLMVHIASVWVPFTSESKEAIAHYPEIVKEMRLALQECGRRVGDLHPQAAARRRRGEEARLHREVHPAGRRSRCRRSSSSRDAQRDEDDRRPDGHPRAQPEGLDDGSPQEGEDAKPAAKKPAKATDRKAHRAERGAGPHDGRAASRARRTSVHDDDREAQEARARVPGALARQRHVLAREAATSRSGARRRSRTLTVNTVKTFAQTLRMMALSKELVETQRLRHQARRLLPVARTGARRASTSRPSPTP